MRCFVLGLLLALACSRIASAQSVCDQQIVLNGAEQGALCQTSVRPIDTNANAVGFVLTSRTGVDAGTPLDPNATGESGSVSLEENGAGTKLLDCSGSSSISGNGEDANEELIFTFDNPIEASSLVLGFFGIEINTDPSKTTFVDDVPVLFLSSASSTGLDITLLDAQVASIATSLSEHRIEFRLGALPNVTPGLLIDQIVVRETTGQIWVDRIGIDCSSDCNGNGIADAIDLEQCAAQNPSCDDCNLNGILDECDIADGTSTDTNGDLTPDDCFEPLVNGANWSQDVWGLTGPNPFPDDVAGIPGLHVTLNAISIFLDVNAQIRTLRLLRGAALEVTQLFDATSGTPGPLRSAGDLRIVFPGGFLNEGYLYVSNDRTLDIPSGPMIISEGGHYQKAPSTSGGNGLLVSAHLSAESITLRPTSCGETEQLTLSDLMTLATVGDLVLDGTGAIPCGFGREPSSAPAGGQTPPIIRFRPTFTETSLQSRSTGSTGLGNGLEFVSATVGGSFRIKEAGEVCVGCGRQTGMNIPMLNVQGDFDNGSRYPSLFDWTNGGIKLFGSSPQVFEVAGLDLGRTWEGFSTDLEAVADTRPHTNFSVGSISIGAGSFVTFENVKVNTQSASSCGEALYVNELTLEPGSTIVLDQVRLYYDVLNDQGGTVIQQGCGELIPLCLPTASQTWSLSANRYTAITGTNNNRMSALSVNLSSLPPALQALEGTRLWVAPPEDVSLHTGSRAPTADFSNIKVATLQCQPYFADWAQIGTVYIYDELIAPGSTIEVTELLEGCSSTDATNFSPPALTSTSIFGDVAGFYTDGTWPGPDGVVSFVSDVLSIVDSFVNQPNAPIKTRTDLEPALPDQMILITDLVVAINAFQGYEYPFATVPTPCP